MNINGVVLILLGGFTLVCEGYNILVALPVGVKSLNNLCSSLTSFLLEKGHQVTFFSSNEQNLFHKNLTFFRPKDFSAHLNEMSGPNLKDFSLFQLYSKIIEAESQIIDEMWTTPDVEDLYNRRNEFDAIITISYANEAFLPFLNEFRGTFIIFCTPGIEYFSMSYMGNWMPLSVVPNFFFPYDEHMTFYERVTNLLAFVFTSGLNYHVRENLNPKIVQYHPQFSGVLDYYHRASLMLINGHFALDSPLPLLPNQIEIGTINAKKPQPLPKDLEEFVGGSGDDGVIYFSFGSFSRADAMKRAKKEIFLEAFRRVPQRVVWKYEGEDLDLPPNVITRKWLPQQDILGHPKTRIFMSHCGNLGTQEARYHGVPVLAIPLGFDQPRNAERLVRKGQAVKIEMQDITPDNIVSAIKELLENPSYQERLTNVSRILQDQKESPGERAVWWIEYVIRHGGAPHLTYPGKRLYYFQYIMLDAIAFCVGVSVLLLLLAFFVCRRALRLIAGPFHKAKKD